jgi:hypothetical protein
VSDLYPTLSLGGQTPVPNDVDQNIIVPPLKSFSQWSASSGSEINDPLLGAQGYADYQRGHFFRTGELNDEVEGSITQGLVGSLLNNGLVTEEEVQAEGFLSTLKPESDVQTKTNLIRMAYGEEAGSIYNNNIQSDSANTEELDKQLNRAKTLLVESGSLPFARITDEKGVQKVIGGAGIENRGEALDTAVRLGGLDYSDAYRVMSGLEKRSGDTSTVFENIRQAELLKEFNGMLGSDEEQDDTAKNALDNMRELIKQKDIKPDLDQEGALSAVIGDMRKALSSSYSRRTGFGEGAALNRFSDKEIKDTIELLAANEVNEKGEFKLYDEDAKNIRILGSGHVLAHPALMQQKERFERAVKSDKRLSPAQATSLRNQRKLYRELTYEYYDKFLSETAATSDNWMEAKQAGRVKGLKDTDVLDSFIADNRNYSSIKNRLGDIAATVPDAVIGMFASLGAIVFKSEGATNYLVENQMDRQRRREVASIFGDDFGWGMDLSNVVAPMVVDISATAFLSATTLGTGGVAYAATKTTATSAAKLAIKKLIPSFVRKQFGDTTREAAGAVASKKALSKAGEKASTEGVQKALKEYNKAVGNKIFRKAATYPPLFLTAANRSAGNTYATVYAAQPDNMTHEEKHDAALGYAMMAGTVTGLITTAFMGLGRGGFEDAFLNKMSVKGLVAGLEKLKNLEVKGMGAAKFKEQLVNIVTKDMQEVLKKRVGNNIKAYGIPAMDEAMEEGLDEFVQTFIMDAALNEDTPMIDRLMTGLHAASLGGVMGAGVVGVRNMMDRGKGARFERLQNEKITEIIDKLEQSDSPLTAAYIRENREALATQLRTASRSREAIDVTPKEIPSDLMTEYENYRGGVKTEEQFDEFAEGETTIEEIRSALNSVTKEESKVMVDESATDRESQAGSIDEPNQNDLQGRQQERFIDSFEDLWMDKEESNRLSEGLTAKDHHARFEQAKKEAEDIADFWGMEVRVDYNEKNKAKGALKAERTKDGMRLVMNPWGMSRLTMGLSRGNAQHVIRFEAAHEVIHHAAWRNLSKAEMDEIFSVLNPTQVNEIIDTYYDTDESRTEARNLLAPDAAPSKQRNMQHIIVDEFLRMKAQTLTKGYTSEEEIEFYKSNPNFVRIFLRYLRSYINRFNATKEKDSENPVIAAALNRLTGEMVRLKGGYSILSTIKFDINDPENNLKILATYLDDRPITDSPDDKIDLRVRETQAGALDAEYMKLAEDPKTGLNDIDLQIMVSEAAKRAGYTYGPVYHGTKSNFTSFKGRESDGLIFFSKSKSFANAYSRLKARPADVEKRIDEAMKKSEELRNKLEYKMMVVDRQPIDEEAIRKQTEDLERSLLDGMTWSEAKRDMGRTVMEGYLKADKVFDPTKNWKEFEPEFRRHFEAKGKEFPLPDAAMDLIKQAYWRAWEIPSVIDAVFRKYDAILINEDQTWSPPENIAVRDNTAIKSSKPITRDDNGDIIPLSERFDLSSQDIRYTQAGALNGQRGGLDSGKFDTDMGGIEYGGYAPLFELAFYETGPAKKRAEGMWRWLDWFTGKVDPRVKRLIEQRRQIQATVDTDFVNFTNQLDLIIKEDFDGKAPVDLIQAIVGSSENITPETDPDFEQRLKTRRKKLGTTKLTKAETQKQRAIFVEEKKAEFRQRRTKAIEELAILQNVDISKAWDTRLVKHLVSLRELTNELSKEIKRIVGPDSLMSVAIDDNLDIYLHRKYRLFTDKEYRKNIREHEDYSGVRDRAATYLFNQVTKHNKNWLSLETREGVKLKDIGSRKDAEAALKNMLLNDYLDLFIKGRDNVSSINLINNLKDNKKSIVNLDIGALKNRQNPPQELRELLGQVKDTESGYGDLLQTFQHLGLVASQINFVEKLKKVGIDNKFIQVREPIGVLADGKTPDYGAVPEGFDILNIKTGSETNLISTAPFADGKQYIIAKDMADDINALLGPDTKLSQGEADSAAEFLTDVGAKLTGLSLGAKTLGSIGFYVRNIVSNVLFFGPLQGMWRPMQLGSSLKNEFIRKYTSMKPEEVSAFHRTLQGLGVIGNDINARLVQDLLRDPLNEKKVRKELFDTIDDIEKASGEKVKGIDKLSDKVGDTKVGKLYGKLRELSQTVDAFYKITYFVHELDVLQKARKYDQDNPPQNLKDPRDSYANRSDSQLMQEAAFIVKETAQSYDQAPPFVQGMNRTWYGFMFAPFIRFKIEVPRILLNTRQQYIKESASHNPIINKRGTRRKTGVGIVLGGMSALGAAAINNLLSNIGDEEDQALRDSMPEYLRTHTFFYYGKGDKLKSVDLTYVNPFAMMVDPFLRAYEQLRRGSPAEAGAAFFKTLVADQYFDQQIFAGALTSALNNRDPETGRQITEANDTAWEAFAKKFQFIWKEAYYPRTPENLLNNGVIKLMEGDPDAADILFTPLGALVSEFLPVRPYDIKLERQFDRFLSERAGEYRRATALKNRMYTDDPMAEGTVRGFADTEIEKRRRINEHLLKTIRGFRKLGLSDEQIYSQATERGYGKRRMALLLNGMMERPALQTPFIRNMAVKGDIHVERLRTFQNQLDTYGRFIPIEEE